MVVSKLWEYTLNSGIPKGEEVRGWFAVALSQQNLAEGSLIFVCEPDVQGGSIKPLLRFGGRFFRIGIKLGTYLKGIIIYAILSILCENSMKNKACVAEIRIFVQNTR